MKRRTNEVMKWLAATWQVGMCRFAFELHFGLKRAKPEQENPLNQKQENFLPKVCASDYMGCNPQKEFHYFFYVRNRIRLCTEIKASMIATNFILAGLITAFWLAQ